MKSKKIIRKIFNEKKSIFNINSEHLVTFVDGTMNATQSANELENV